jgi:hypothetical protein
VRPDEEGPMVRRLALLCVLVVALVATTTPGDAVTRAKAASATGEWSGTWKRTSAPPTTGTMTVTFTQTGTKLSGSENVVGSACLTNHDVKGSAKSGKVAWTVSESNIKANYTGSISGKKLTGKLSVTCSGVTGVGTFSLTKT